MKDKMCKHKWHFMQKGYEGGETSYGMGKSGFIMPVHYEPIRKTFAVFVCENCGELKKVEIKNER